MNPRRLGAGRIDTKALLETLPALVEERRLAESRVAARVVELRQEGATWTAIAKQLGVTPQAVSARYGVPRGGGIRESEGRAR